MDTNHSLTAVACFASELAALHKMRVHAEQWLAERSTVQ